MRTVEFKVMDIATATEEEAEYCYVNEDTEILYEGESLKVSCGDLIIPVSWNYDVEVMAFWINSSILHLVAPKNKIFMRVATSAASRWFEGKHEWNMTTIVKADVWLALLYEIGKMVIISLW